MLMSTPLLLVCLANKKPCFLQHISQGRPGAGHSAVTATSTHPRASCTPCAAPDLICAQVAPAAHRGFLARARAVDTRALLREAERHGRRLVFCGADAALRMLATPPHTACKHVGRRAAGLRPCSTSGAVKICCSECTDSAMLTTLAPQPSLQAVRFPRQTCAAQNIRLRVTWLQHHARAEALPSPRPQSARLPKMLLPSRCSASALPRGAAGHSLGGAVAQLCALDLLHGPASDQPCEGPYPDPALDLPHAAAGARPPAVAAIGWATPAVGNAALAELVAARGWGARLVTFLLPGAPPAPRPALPRVRPCARLGCLCGA